jgi:murein DD-endopeptidase MepM/ murein hydrolase activator NlpD
MSGIVELLSSRRAPQAAILAIMSFAFSGCSADMQTRLSQDNMSNPFGRESTGSVRQSQNNQGYNNNGYNNNNGYGSGGSYGQQQQPQRELPQYQRPQYSQAPQYQSQPLPPPIAAPQSYPVVQTPSTGVSGGGRGVASYTPPAREPIETTASTAPRSVAATNGLARDGGTSIIVGTSDTLDGLAKRYNVSSASILQANGYKGPRALSPGQSLIIPRQSVAAAPAAPVAAAPVAAAPKPVASVVTTPASSHVVNRGDTLASVARANKVSVADLARANNVPANGALKLGSRLTVPATKSVVAAAAPAPVAVPVAAPVAAAVAPVATRVAAAVPEPVQKVRMASTATPPEVAAAVPESPVKTAEATGALPTFRWPVRGRVITSYGAKSNGKANDGINVAVPEGTPVKAAEDGVVAYSGNELKGYGNLILVRHSNGYVTAYAHASELMVKRGETIKRGQVIAKSGQSGEVGSPQLHFEIRKGSSPVDPQQFLSGG